MKSKIQFVFKTEKTFRKEHIEITAWQSAELRRTLPKGIYWLQIVPGGLVQWNVQLLMDYLVNGDRPAHQELVERYAQSLPVAA
jgi:hypothetical protein